MKLLSLSEKKRALDFSIGNRHMIRAILWNLRFAKRRGYDRSEKKMFGRNPKEGNEETGEVWYSNYVIAGRSCSFPDSRRSSTRFVGKSTLVPESGRDKEERHVKRSPGGSGKLSLSS